MELTNAEYNSLLDWIRGNLIRTEKYNHLIDSGSLRTAFEQSPEGFYVDSDTFKQAMLDCDYIPYSEKAPYWEFKVSMDSPGITRFFGRG